MKFIESLPQETLVRLHKMLRMLTIIFALLFLLSGTTYLVLRTMSQDAIYNTDGTLLPEPPREGK